MKSLASVFSVGAIFFTSGVVFAQSPDPQNENLTIQCGKISTDESSIEVSQAVITLGPSGESKVSLVYGEVRHSEQDTVIDNTTKVDLPEIKCSPVAGKKYDFFCGDKIAVRVGLNEDGEKLFVINYYLADGSEKRLDFSAAQCGLTN